MYERQRPGNQLIYYEMSTSLNSFERTEKITPSCRESICKGRLLLQNIFLNEYSFLAFSTNRPEITGLYTINHGQEVDGGFVIFNVHAF